MRRIGLKEGVREAMKHNIFAVAVSLMLSTPAQADLEEKTWKTMSDDFQLGYLWGTLDTAVTKVWDRRPAAKTPMMN